MTTEWRQRKVEQWYIKSQCTWAQYFACHNKLLDTIMCWTQKYVGNSNLLDQLHFGHLFRFTISSIKHTFQISEISEFGHLLYPFRNKIAKLSYGPSISHKD